MENLFRLQKGKDINNLKTAYIFKGLGHNLIPFTPNEKQLDKMKSYIKDMLVNKGESSDEKAISSIIGKSPKIGLDISLMERKFVNAMTIFIGNSTLMDKEQSNKYYKNKNLDYKIEAIDYKNLKFVIPTKYMNKLFGRSIKEKGRDGKNIVEQLSARKFFLINNKGNIKYEKAFNMIIKDNYFVFTFHSFLIGRLYDSRKNFFDDINSLYEALFFEFLFDKTKSFRREKKDHICFTTRSILKDIDMEELVKTHKQYVISVLNTCFNKAFKKGILKEKFEYTNETFNKDDKVHINIPINSDFQW